jgi:hypothetical protein
MRDRCAKCNRALKPQDHIWRVRVRRGRGPFGGARICFGAYCEQCAEKHIEFYSYYKAKPCDNCGRMVHDTVWRVPRRYVYCCEHCQLTYQSKRLAAAARQRRADARDPSRPCLECGECFEPERADAQYCCSAHRQLAYRKRKAVTFSEQEAMLPIRKP